MRKQVNQKVFGSESEELTEAEENFWENLEDMKKDLKPKKLELLDRTMALILDLYTVFLSIKDQDNEALKRRSAIDRCARQMRSFGSQLQSFYYTRFTAFGGKFLVILELQLFFSSDFHGLQF